MFTPSKQLWAKVLAAVFLCLPLGLAHIAPVAAQADQTRNQDPRLELRRMANALQTLSYEGTLTYEFGGPLETLFFKHRIAGDGRHESIRHLSGLPRSFSRQQPSDGCGNAAARLFTGSAGSPLAAIEANYNLKLLGQNRIADRTINLVQIKPKQADRYGFTVGIDRESHLPLMLTINSPRGKTLERFQFVELTLAPVENTQFNLDSAKRLALADQRCAPPMLETTWQPEWLPPGYILASVAENEATDAAKLNYTDGLSSISIVVSPITKASPAVGVVQRGATVAAMTMAAHNQASYKVSVVGEVPPAVARRIAASVRYIP